MSSPSLPPSGQRGEELIRGRCYPCLVHYQQVRDARGLLLVRHRVRDRRRCWERRSRQVNRSDIAVPNTMNIITAAQSRVRVKLRNGSCRRPWEGCISGIAICYGSAASWEIASRRQAFSREVSTYLPVLPGPQLIVIGDGSLRKNDILPSSPSGALMQNLW